MQLEEIDLALRGGRTLHIYDTVPEGGAGHLVIVWHHGTPNRGAPPEPLFAAAERTGIRWVSYDRPSYGGSTPCSCRTPLSSPSGSLLKPPPNWPLIII